MSNPLASLRTALNNAEQALKDGRSQDVLKNVARAGRYVRVVSHLPASLEKSRLLKSYSSFAAHTGCPQQQDKTLVLVEKSQSLVERGPILSRTHRTFTSPNAASTASSPVLSPERKKIRAGYLAQKKTAKAPVPGASKQKMNLMLSLGTSAAQQARATERQWAEDAAKTPRFGDSKEPSAKKAKKLALNAVLRDDGKKSLVRTQDGRTLRLLNKAIPEFKEGAMRQGLHKKEGQKISSKEHDSARSGKLGKKRKAQEIFYENFLDHKKSWPEEDLMKAKPSTWTYDAPKATKDMAHIDEHTRRAWPHKPRTAAAIVKRWAKHIPNLKARVVDHPSLKGAKAIQIRYTD